MSWFSLFLIGPGVSGEVDDSHGRVLNIYVDGYEWATRLEWCGGLPQVPKREGGANWWCQVFWLGRRQPEEIHGNVQQGWGVHWPAGAPEVDQILWEGKKHCMLFRTTKYFTVCLCTSLSQCKCWEGFLTDAEPLDKGEEPALCWVIERDYICAIQLQRHFLQILSCLFVKQQKTAGKDQLYSKI